MTPRNSAGKLKPVADGATRPSYVIVSDPASDFPTTIDSGAINEKQLIAVLAEMCRCLLAAQRKQEPVPATIEPAEGIVPIVDYPNVV
jgi:hypothetical protein